MREIAEIELAIQGGTEKIETLGGSSVDSMQRTINNTNTLEQASKARWTSRCMKWPLSKR